MKLNLVYEEALPKYKVSNHLGAGACVVFRPVSRVRKVAHTWQWAVGHGHAMSHVRLQTEADERGLQQLGLELSRLIEGPSCRQGAQRLTSHTPPVGCNASSLGSTHG